MRYLIGAAVVALALPCGAMAATFSGGWTASANASDPGLVVSLSSASGAVNTSDLAVGQSYSFNLFRIWTDEATVNRGEDDQPQPISVSFAFTDPVVSGTTVGQTFGERSLLGVIQQGRVVWNGPLTLSFGQGGTGRMTISLSNGVFNSGVGGLDEGATDSALVRATLRYDQAPVSSPAAVPLPATLPLLAAGVGAIGLAARRRRDKAS